VAATDLEVLVHGGAADPAGLAFDPKSQL